MKNLILTSLLIFAICICQSQIKSNLEYSKKTIDCSKYVGKYHLKNIDTLITFDYFDITEKNNKLYCVRESEVLFIEAATKKVKNTSKRFDCEVIYVNINEGKISFKFNDKVYNYTIRINQYTKRYEIVIIENALVYEKR